MKSRVIGIIVCFLIVIAGITAFIYVGTNSDDYNEVKSSYVVDINEIKQLILSEEYEEAVDKAQQLSEQVRADESTYRGNTGVLVLGAVAGLFVLVVFAYVYFSILRPFYKMKYFASEVAKGNFDVPLHYERSNYFGEFTWAFDSMRREITKARACEQQAIENNKTVIATLSHDIKTPVASIRAYAEGLEANLDNTPEKRRIYLDVIMKKCDEVAGLTNDLFLHSLSDLNKLQVSLERVELSSFMKESVHEIMAGHKDIKLDAPDSEIYVLADAKRLLQILENLINNARKYAKTDVVVTLKRKEDKACISVRDYGKGIPDEDMPFIYDKFYRGGNCGKEQGSGLGLYIVKYIAGQMKGDVFVLNLDNGLQVTVSLPIDNI